MEHQLDARQARRYARVGGALYLVVILVGMAGELLVRRPLLVDGDAAATAANLASSLALVRVAVAAEMAMIVCGVGLVVVLYALLKPVHRYLALFVVFLNLITLALEASGKMTLIVAASLLGGSALAGAFEPGRINALAAFAVSLHAYGFALSLIFFGAECVVIGYLIYRSGFLPRSVGVLMALAGTAYLVNSFALLLAPPLASRVSILLVLSFVGESSLCVWLLAKGVNAGGWDRRLANGSIR